ncbi:site-specific integrase [Pseudonocardia ailaonensis]|uniref:Site-specific integrase n=1 Tax=Pseudonocardia ailaonensis TaxID=367279 RepID=A0ABN2MP56_9PSEU
MDPQVTARITALDAAADHYLDAERVASTREAYARDWTAWEDYTRWAGIPLLSGGRGALVGFVLWHEQGSPRAGRPAGEPAAPATIRRRLAGALHGLRRFGADLDARAPAAAREALVIYRRRLTEGGIARGRGQAHAVDLKAVLAMSAACPDTRCGRRDRAMITLGFYGATRASDQAHLLATDVTVEQNGVVLDVRVGKTTGRSALPRRRHPLLCPRAAWLAWREVTGPGGPAFRRVDRHDTVHDAPLSPDAVTAVIARAGARAGLDHAVTCHSLRAGFATESYRAGASLLDIATQGRWAPGSQELFRYIRTVDQWRHNAADGLDLDP